MEEVFRNSTTLKLLHHKQMALEMIKLNVRGATIPYSSRKKLEIEKEKKIEQEIKNYKHSCKLIWKTIAN